MSYENETENSIPFMDENESTTCEDDMNHDQCTHVVSITEKHRNQDKSFRIKNSPPNGLRSSSSGTAASFSKIDLKNRDCELVKSHRVKRIPPKDSVMSLVIKGWNSTVSIQGLNNHSSITFKRKIDRSHKEREIRSKRNENFNEQPENKKMKKRWRMLTKSLVGKTSKYENRGFEERYPKYVLLRDEDEEEEERIKKMRGKNNGSDTSVVTDKTESYPKMVILSDRTCFRKETKSDKKNESEFRLKRSFKNKTEPLQSIANPEVKKNSAIQSKRNNETKSEIYGERKNFKITPDKMQRRAKSTESCERRKSLPRICDDPFRRSFSQDNVFCEIEGLLKEAVNLYPGGSPQPVPPEVFAPGQSHICAVSHPCDRLRTTHCETHISTRDSCCHCDVYDLETSQTRTIHLSKQDQIPEPKGGDHPQNMEIRILSDFFSAPVMIMKSYENQYSDVRGSEPPLLSGKPQASCNSVTEPSTSIAAIPDLQLNQNKPLSDDNKFEEKSLENLSDKVSSDEEDKTKTDETEMTQYMFYGEEKKGEDDYSTTLTTNCTFKEKDQTYGNKEKNHDNDEGTKPKFEENRNLSLTEIGYKMYDNLTRMSLTREKDIARKPGAKEDGQNLSEVEHSPSNVTLESTESFIKIYLHPDNKMNLKIVNEGNDGSNIRIGLGSKLEMIKAETAFGNENKIAYPSDMRGVQRYGNRDLGESIAAGTNQSQGSNVKLAVRSKDEVFLTFETSGNDEKSSASSKKETKEMNVGTNDFELTEKEESSGKNHFRNLSPRKSKLLRSLKEKLEDRGRRIYLTPEAIGAEETSQKPRDEKADFRNHYSGIFLVKQICGNQEIHKKPSEMSTLQEKFRGIPDTEEEIREYYCEDCLATMKLFEEKNPSVKSMVNKFETIIQLESF